MPNWRRDEQKLTQHPAGYLFKWVGHEHPAAVRGRILEHRWVLEQALGRYLHSSEHVHHINGDKTDNRLENLLLMTSDEHQKLHAATDHVQARSRRVTLTCHQCGTAYERKLSRAAESRYCSQACRVKARPEVMRTYWARKRAEQE